MHRATRVAAVVAASLTTLGAFAVPSQALAASAVGGHVARATAHRIAAPTVSVSPNPISNATKGMVTVAGSAPGGTTVAISISDGTSTPVTSTGTVVNNSYSVGGINVASLKDGTLTASVTTSDATGTTTSAPGTGTATKDTVAPVTTLIVPAYVTTSPTTISGDTDPLSTIAIVADDSGNVLTQVEVKKTVKADVNGHWTTEIATADMAEGSITWSATPTDVAGNAGTAVTKTSTKDVTAPSAPATVKGSPTRYLNGTFNVTGTTAMGDRTATDLKVDVTVTDVAGTVLTATNQTVTPATSTQLAGTFSVPFGATQMATLVEGTLTLKATFHDAAGNASPTTSGTAENGPLTLKSTAPTNGSTVKAPSTVTATYNQVLSSAGSGTTSTIAVTNASGTAVAGATTISGTTISFKPTAAFADGVYHVTVTAYDKFDTTVSSTDTFSFTVDATAAPGAPVVTTFTDPINTANQTMVTVAGSSQLAASPVVVSVGTLAPQTVTSSATGAWTATFDVTTLADGTLTASATQSDGTKTSDAGTRTATKDTVAPTLTSSTPATGATTTSPDTVSMVFSEALGTGSITIQGVDGTTAVSGSTATFTPTSTLADGTYTANATVTDAVGNPGTAAITFTVDSTPKTASTITLTAPAQVVIGQAITLTGKVTQTTAATYGQVVLKATTASGQVVSLGTVDVDANGVYTKTLKPSVNATYQAGYAGDDANTTSVSAKRKTLVASKVTASSATGKHTAKATIKGSVLPGGAGTKVTIYQVKSGGKKVKIATATIASSHQYSVKVSLPKGTTKLVAQVAATSNNAAGSVSFSAKRT